MKTLWTAILVSLIFAALPARGQTAAPEEPAPGEYIREGDSGVLTLSRPSDQTLGYSLEAMGPNGHMCGFEGTIQGNRGDIDLGTDTEQPGPPCVITFQRNAEGLDVSDNGAEACRMYCGMRAHFEGEYLTPGPGCTREEGQAACAQFKRLYASKSSGEAAELLESQAVRCAKTVGVGPDCTLNDLAITQYHLGRLADCRKTLEPLAADSARSDEELKSLYLPTDFEMILPAVRAARHNLEAVREEAALTQGGLETGLAPRLEPLHRCGSPEHPNPAYRSVNPAVSCPRAVFQAQPRFWGLSSRFSVSAGFSHAPRRYNRLPAAITMASGTKQCSRPETGCSTASNNVVGRRRRVPGARTMFEAGRSVVLLASNNVQREKNNKKRQGRPQKAVGTPNEGDTGRGEGAPGRRWGARS